MRRFEYVYSFAPMRPPRVSVTTFTSYICCIYILKFGQYWTLLCMGSSSVSSMPCMQFLFVRPRLCRGLPSDSTSRWTPLPLANSSYCQVCSGLSPPSDSACRAHHTKTACRSAGCFLFKFGFIAELCSAERYKIRRYKIQDIERLLPQGYFISCIFVSCNLYLAEKNQFFLIIQSSGLRWECSHLVRPIHPKRQGEPCADQG